MNKKHTAIKMLIVFSLYLTFLAENVNAQITSPSPYCIAGFDDEYGDVPDAVTSVSIGTLANTTAGQCAFPHYIFYNNLTAPDLSKGSSYTLTINFAVSGSCGYGVWIDYNHNDIFELTEMVSSTVAYNPLPYPTASITDDITIPATAITGITRMRVRMVEDDDYNAANHFIEAPCNLSTSADDVMDWGETEDYNVNITAPTGVQEQSDESSSIVPNPSDGVFYLEFSNNQPFTIAIYNLVGEIICEKKYGAGLGKHEIDLTRQSKGIYVVKITTTANRTIVKKIIVQ